jgi:REP element-mobilizing transposase RayT
MTDYYKGYRIASARRPGYDYSQEGAYFITICTAQRRHFFGHIPVRPVAADQILHPTPVGTTAQECWYTIPDHHPHIALGAFIVMPNHIHGILHIKAGGIQPHGSEPAAVQTPGPGVLSGSIHPAAQSPQNPPATPPANPRHHPEWKSGSIGVIINQYKGAVTRLARPSQPDFAWQTRFHDHIIRDAAEYDRIHDYILNNPAKWHSDRFYGRK